jgi:hypothetical protein
MFFINLLVELDHGLVGAWLGATRGEDSPAIKIGGPQPSWGSVPNMTLAKTRAFPSGN